MRPSQVNGGPTPPTFWQATASGFLSRTIVIGAGVASSLLLPLILDQRAVGQYFVSQLIIAALATLSQLGLTYSIPAIVTDAAAKSDLGRARSLAAVMMGLCSAVGLSVGLLVATSSDVILSIAAPVDPAAWRTILMLAAATVPFAALSAIVVELLRGIHAAKTAAKLSALSSIFAAIYAGIVFSAGLKATVNAALLASLAGSAVCVLLGIALLRRLMRNWTESPRTKVCYGSVLRHTLPNLVTTMLLFGMSTMDILILSVFGELKEVAEYGIALRFSSLMLIPLAVVNSASAPLSVHARSQANLAVIRSTLANVVVTGASMAALLYAGFGIFGLAFIAFWNPSYYDAFWLTLILGLGNVLHACGGSAGVLLMIWGDQKRAFVITGVTGLFTVILCLLGYRYSGLFGLATAAALGNVCQVTCFVLRVRQAFGQDPSIVGALRRA